LTPRQAGLPAAADPVRRRTPGLRRQEVAQLAGISVDYYIRMEQGRGPHPSRQVLAALARALMLTADEREYLSAEAFRQLARQDGAQLPISTR
jgi:transcriptional regulator with XRE-family HTH domain